MQRRASFGDAAWQAPGGGEVQVCTPASMATRTRSANDSTSSFCIMHAPPVLHRPPADPQTGGDRLVRLSLQDLAQHRPLGKMSWAKRRSIASLR